MKTTQIVESVSGTALSLRGDDIDTDRIIPARFLRCVTFDGLEQHVFEDDRLQSGGKHAFDDPARRGAGILIVGRNFGCGSSREHAPQGLLRWGIHGIVGVSFAEIFFGNCVSLGVPCVVLSPADVETLRAEVEKDPHAKVSLDVRTGKVSIGSKSHAYMGTIPEGARQNFLGGTWDATGMLLQDADQIRSVAQALPYTRAFSA
jgi:3-isopropylmalate/(R)-2-methylmalate dehydratase small subunit